MIYEHRTYTLVHGTMAEYLKRYETYGLPVQKKHLGRLLGFFVSEIGPLNQVVHIWVYDSLADREQRRAAMEADPDWTAFKKTNKGSFTAQDVKIMVGAPFNPQFI